MMKHFLKNYIGYIKQAFVAVLVLASFAAFAKPNDSISPLLHSGGGAQKITDCLAATNYNTCLSNALLQLGGRGVSWFEKGTGSAAHLLVLDTFLNKGELILASGMDSDSDGQFDWDEPWGITRSADPVLETGNGILSTEITNSTSRLDLCVETDGSIVACQSAVCKAYTGTQNSQPATNDITGCDTGTYSDISDSPSEWKWECTEAGVTIGCTAIRPATNGTCIVYGGQHGTQPATDTASGCGDGTYSDSADSNQSWGWQCLGSNGGSNTTCSEYKTDANGSCVAYTDPAGYTTEPATDTATGCTSGSFNNTADSGTHWQWDCLGEGQNGTDTNCSALAQVVNGQCVTYGGYHEPSPATDTASGCVAGTFAPDTEQDTRWTWKCLGSGAGTDASCDEDKQLGECVNYTNYQVRTSQPATDDVTGCVIGSYVDVADISDQYAYHPNQAIDTYLDSYNWMCNYGSTSGQNRDCAVYTEQITGACNTSWTGSYATQPAYDDATGCTAGHYEDMSDTGTDYKWRCIGQNSGGNDNTCSATIQASPPVDVCDPMHQYCVYYCAGDATLPTGNFSWQILQTNTPEYASAPWPFDPGGADCDIQNGNVHPDLSNGWMNYCQNNPDSLCSEDFAILNPTDRERYYCGEETIGYPPGEAIDIWENGMPPMSSPIFTGAKCESF